MPFYASLRTRWFVGDGGDAETPSPQRVGRVWIKPHIGRHDEQGAYENLVEDLRHDPAEFEKFHRVNPATFDFLLAKVDGVISRQNTTYRASISAVSGSAMRHGNVSL